MSSVLAAIEVILGLAVYTTPSVASAAAGGIEPYSELLAAALVAGGVALLFATRHRINRMARSGLHLIAAAPLLVLATVLGLAGKPDLAITYGALAVGPFALLRPTMSENRLQSSSFDLIVTLVLAATGGFLFFWSRRYSGGASAHGLVLALPWGMAAAVRLFNFSLRGRPAEQKKLEPSLLWSAAEPLLVLESAVESWIWVAILVVMVLPVTGQPAVFALLGSSRLFVAVASIYNIVMHFWLPGFSTVDRRVEWHLVFLTLGLGLLLLGAGTSSFGVWAMLAAIPTLTSWSLGKAAGRRLLTLAVVVAAASEFTGWLAGVQHWTAAALMAGVKILVLTATAGIGIRSAGQLRGLLYEIYAQSEQLRAQQEELQAMNREMRTRQEELQSVNAELVRRGRELREGRDQLAITLEQLRESEECFQLGLSNSPIGMAIKDRSGKFRQVNTALRQMLGYTEAELVGRNFRDITYPGDIEEEEVHLRQLLAGEIDSYQAEKRYLHRGGRHVWAVLNASLVRSGEGAPLYFIAQIQDITDRKEAEARLAFLADHDPLTELVNRRRFQETLESYLSGDGPAATGAIMILDLDEFKYVNDTLGHAAGDDLLCTVATRLQTEVGEDGMVARLGGDEFGILLPGADARTAKAMAARILMMVRRHAVMVAGRPISSTASIGIALYPNDGSGTSDLLARADVALYRAKAAGRNRFVFYEPDTTWQTEMEAKLTWEPRIRQALAENRFILLGQPIRCLRRNEITHYELLLRMRDDQGGMILPREFLDIAESSGLIHVVDRWVVREAIQLISHFRRSGRNISLAVNLSGKAFTDAYLLPLVQGELASTGIPPGNLIFEITETAIVTDLLRAQRFIEILKGWGCRFAIDDFGAGFASFSHLKYLPVDYLKIDGSFIEDLADSEIDRHLVQAMVAVGRGLGKETIAEFVGNATTMQLLLELGADHAQGFFIGMPRPITEI